MRKQNLTLSIFIAIVTLAAITLLVTGGLWIRDIEDRFQLESKQLRDVHVAAMKTELQHRVDALVQFIEYRKKTTETQLKNDIRARVHDVKSIIENIYLSHKDTLPRAEIEVLIRESLRNVRFNQGRGYYFIDTLDGDVILYPIFAESEGKNLLKLQDERGHYVLQQEINLVKQHGEGFIVGYWKKPGDSVEPYKKIAYVHGFKPYNWYFGTGEYVDDVNRQIQHEIIEYINHLKYGDNGEQYIFVHDLDGVEIANGLFPELIGINNYELEDLKGVKVTQAQMDLATGKEGGGFLVHYWPEKSGGEEVEKLTYVTLVPGWNWVIGTGMSMARIEQAIEAKRAELLDNVHEQMMNSGLILLAIFILSLLIARWMAASINKNVQVFVQHMELSSHNLTRVDPEAVEYQDFKELAHASNQMTDRINTLLHRDALTNLYNRGYINRILETLTANASNTSEELSVILFDIDNFKLVNDSYGHQVGDQVLIDVATVIESTVRGCDYVGRYGGEEIVVILPVTSQQRAVDIGDRIRVNIEQQVCIDGSGPVTMSGGIATGCDYSADELIKIADTNLYEAKRGGRNRIVG